MRCHRITSRARPLPTTHRRGYPIIHLPTTLTNFSRPSHIPIYFLLDLSSPSRSVQPCRAWQP